MKLITTGLASVLLAAGVAGSVAAYRSQSVQDVSVPTVRTTHAADPAASVAAEPRQHRTRWAPCPKGSKLEKGTCVTDVVHTVVVPAPAAPAPSPAAPAVPVVVRGSGGQPGGGEDGGRDDAGPGDDSPGDDGPGDDSPGDDHGHDQDGPGDDDSEDGSDDD
ncbi:hypothetical protein [Nocardioides panacisoli]|uniref:Uncharacterized protein n=1 Tax=Nocardioides panacisoli TaxID=627624 RepID=A0ABP7HUH6_9ACTN